MWWNAATTFDSGSSACTSSADEPAGGGVNSRGPPKLSATTVLTTTLPRHVSRAGGSVAARPAAGSATTTMSPSAAASAFSLPTIVSFLVRSRSSTALSCARVASREPMMIAWPTSAQRVASPEPSLPVPPRIAMLMGTPLSEEVSRRIAQQALAADAVVGRQGEPADEGRRHAGELAHHRLGGGGELVGERQHGRLQRSPGRIALAEVTLERREAGDADRDVRETFAPRPPERIGDDHTHVAARRRAEALTQRARRPVGILGQQRNGVGVDVGLVHAGV